MPRHIFVKQESTDDHISIFYDEPAFIVVANRLDLYKINLLEESHKPGIYILLSDHKRYVGQASGSVFSRIQQHDVSKPWWQRVIFFGREDGHLNKAQLDFIESKLIHLCKTSCFELDNGTLGNTSYIDKLSEISAISLLNNVDETLREVANVNLFDQLDQTSRHKDSLKDVHSVYFMNQTFENKSARMIFLSVLKFVLDAGYIDALTPVFSDTEPNTTHFLGTQSKMSMHGNVLTSLITGTSYYAYSTFSKDVLYKKLEIIAKLVQVPILIDFK